MDITIKEIDLDDDYIEYCELLKQLTSIDSTTFTCDDFKEHMKNIIANPFHKIYIAIDNGKIIGTITLLVEPKIIHNLSFVGHIEDVVIDQAYRSFGIGKHLVRKAVDTAERMKCYKVVLDCTSDNLEFYKRCGFKEKEKQMALYF